MKKYIFLLLTIIIFSTCDNQNVPDCLKKTGDIIKFNQPLDKFTAIFLYDAFTAKLVKDTVNYLEVECGKNLKDNLGFKVDSTGLLTIHDDSFCGIVRNNSDMPSVTIHYTQPISDLYLYGNSYVYSTDSVNVARYVFTSRAGKLDVISNCDNVGVDVWLGTGEYTIKGKAKYFHSDARGTSKIDASELIAQKAVLETHSSCDMYVNISDSITCKFFWSGNIYTKNNPHSIVENNKNSTGKLITNY